MGDKLFCALFSAFDGEKIDHPNQLTICRLDGHELKELVEFAMWFCLDQAKHPEPTEVSMDFINGIHQEIGFQPIIEPSVNYVMLNGSQLRDYLSNFIKIEQP